MSRVGKNPIPLPAGVQVTLADGDIEVKGPKGTLRRQLHADVDVVQAGSDLNVSAKRPGAWAMAGTTRALVANMVVGVSTEFSRALDLVGVGFRAQMKGPVLNLSVGYSHPVDLTVPEGLRVETPTQTQITVRGVDKQRVGQFAANVRSVRPPEPYKGKGIRYNDERVVLKEAKKK